MKHLDGSKNRSKGITRLTVLCAIVLPALVVYDSVSGPVPGPPLYGLAIIALVCATIPFIIRQIGYWIYEGFRSN